VVKDTVNVSIHKIVDYELLNVLPLGYIVHSSYSLRALGYDIFLTCENPEIRSRFVVAV
jgi:hypothetical protein